MKQAFIFFGFAGKGNFFHEWIIGKYFLSLRL